VRVGRKRHDLDGDTRAASCLDQVPELLAHHGGVFRRFLDGFRYDSEANR
jgi:hypothetical protein